MAKRLFSILLILTLVLNSLPVTYAHDNQKGHDKDLFRALFGTTEISLSKSEKTIFQAIADAAALSIDQFSSNVTLRNKEATFNKLQEELQHLNLPRLPYSFDDLDLNLNQSADGKSNITANTHRQYTHLGWNCKEYPNPTFWNTRKQVLLHVVNWTLFNDKATFSWVPWANNVLYGPSEQCDAFCAMVYYIHILGDHIEGDKPEKLTDLEPLIQYTSLSTPGIITELQEQLQIVFPSQTGSWTYAALMNRLTALKLEAEKNCGTWGSIDTPEKCKINQQYANELIDILADYLPQLLANEPFFSSHFKTNR